MRFNTTDTDFLKGTTFSEGAEIKLIGKPAGISRLEYLQNLSKGKKVIHFGCADHKNLIEKKISEGTYLHKILTDSSDTCIGLDINKESIEFLNKNLQFTNVFEFDLFNPKLPSEISSKKFDYVIMGEILEHVDNPVSFLQKMKEVFAPYCENIVVTVPNSFALITQLKAFKGVEYINTDHRYWFTPFTLAKVAYNAGLKPEEVEVVFGFKLDLKKKIIAKMFPFAGDSIVGIFKF